MANFIMWLVIGAFAGRMVTWLMGTRESLLLNMLVGVIGAVVAGLVVTPYFEVSPTNRFSFSLSAILVAVGGAVVLLALLHFFRRWGGLLD